MTKPGRPRILDFRFSILHSRTAALASLIVLASCANPARTPESQRRVLAIAALESKEFLGGPRLAEIATDCLQDLLVHSNKFTVVERRKLDRVVDEQAKEPVEKAGKLVGADLVAYGAVTETVLYSETVPNGPRRFAEIVIQARVVRTDTGKIVYSGEKRGLSNVPQPARASKPEQFAFDEALLNRAARDAVEKLSGEIAALDTR